jgi:pyocin large subunit-like protein
MENMAATRFALLAAAAAVALTACDNGPSAVAQQQAAGTQMARAPDAAGPDAAAPADTARVDRRDEPVKLVDGKPMWSASRRYSAEQNAERVFRRNGEAFGAETLNEFVKKAHAFVEHPPKGTLTFTRRNGDKLFYDPRGNVFAVATSGGAPRTMFKPEDGMAYWEEQKARETRQAASRGRRDRTQDDEA